LPGCLQSHERKHEGLAGLMNHWAGGAFFSPQSVM